VSLRVGIVPGRSTRSLEGSVNVIAIVFTGVLQVVPVPEKPDAALEADLVYLEALARRNPEKDANASLRKGEKSFLGVAGYAVTIPGISEKLAECPAVHNQAIVIRGTTDYLRGGERHRQLNDLAREYAVRYNAVISRSRSVELSRECAAL
jgi:hypothetical protein